MAFAIKSSHKGKEHRWPKYETLVLLNLPSWSTTDDIMNLVTVYFDEDFPFKVKVKMGTQNQESKGNKINPGYAFIEVPDAEALDIAMRRLRQADLQIEGRKITVQRGKLAGPESETKKREQQQKEQKEMEQQKPKKAVAVKPSDKAIPQTTAAESVFVKSEVCIAQQKGDENEKELDTSSTAKATEESEAHNNNKEKEDVTGGAKKPIKKKQNDRWICPACGYKSWARKTNCFKCDAPRPADALIESNISKPDYSSTGNINGNVKKSAPPATSTSTESVSTTVSTSTTTPAKQVAVPVAKTINPVSLREFKVRCRRAERMSNNTSSELASFRVVAPRGLLNVSNTCFRNSVLQLLFAAKPFSDLLVELVRSFASKQEIPPSLASWSEILNIAYALCVYGVTTVPIAQRLQAIREQGKLAEHKPIDVTAAMPFICNGFKRYTQHSIALSEIMSSNKKTDESSISATSSNESEEKELPPLRDVQEDAMEFVDFLLDLLHEEELCNDDSTEDNVQSKSLDDSMNEDEMEFELDPSSMKTTEEDEWEVVSKPGTKKVVDSKSKQETSKEAAATMISRLFHCRVRSEFTNSNRKMTSITFQRLHCLSLQIANAKSLSELLAAYFSEEMLENAAPKEGSGKTFYGDRSSGKSSSGGAKKKVSLDSVPPILMLQLNRFHYDKKKNTPVKITKKISYPIDLNLSEQYLSIELAEKARMKFTDSSGKVSPDIQEALMTYKLVGFIMHHGESANSGHYTTVYRDQDEIWWHCDDSRVSQIGQERALEFVDEVYILIYSNK